MDPLDLLGQLAEVDQIEGLLADLAPSLEAANPDALDHAPLDMAPLATRGFVVEGNRAAQPQVGSPATAVPATALGGSSAPGLQPMERLFARFNWKNSPDFRLPHAELAAESAAGAAPSLGMDDEDPFDLGIDALLAGDSFELDTTLGPPPRHQEGSWCAFAPSDLRCVRLEERWDSLARSRCRGARRPDRPCSRWRRDLRWQFLQHLQLVSTMTPLQSLLAHTDQVHFGEAELLEFERLAKRAVSAVRFAAEVEACQDELVSTCLSQVKPSFLELEEREPQIWERLRGELQLLLRLALQGWGLDQPERCSPKGLGWLRKQHETLEQPAELMGVTLAALEVAARAKVSAECATALEEGLTAAAEALSQPATQV